MQVGSVYHTGFTVSDLDRSIGFYRDLLGMRVVRRQHGTADYLGTVTGFPGVRLEVALQAPVVGGSLLEQLQYVSHPGAPTPRETNRPGNAHLCFKVDDLHAASAELERHGVTMISKPTEITAGLHRGGYALYLRDPDGFTVELYQAPPTAESPSP